jgi:deoxycytidine triphosphate deaminase
MADHTLVDREIRNYAQTTQLLQPWAEDAINGASYDIRVGRLAFQAASSAPLGFQARDISVERSIILESGHVVVIESLERVSLPQNMKGYLSLRNTLSSKMLFFTSGKVHPGHRGFLYFPLINLGDEPVTLTHGQRLVAMEFIEIDPPAEIVGPDFSTIPQGLLPRFRPRPAFSLLFSQVEDITAKFSRYELVSQLNVLVVGSLILAVIAGIIAGVTVQLLPSQTTSSTGSGGSFGGAAIFNATVIVFSIGVVLVFLLSLWLVWRLFSALRSSLQGRINRRRMVGR